MAEKKLPVIALSNGQELELPEGIDPQSNEALLIVDQAEAAILSRTKAQPPPESPEFDPLTGGLRKVEFASRGAVDSLLETLGNIPDAVAWGLRKAGVPAPPEGYYKGALKKGFYDLGRTISSPLNAAVNFGPGQPVSTGERVAYGAGRGVGDAASFIIPGAALAKTAKAGGLASNIGKAIASQPAMQTVAGAAGGAVTEATDSPTAGLASALAVPLVAALGRRAITPVPRQLSPQETKLAQTAQNIGVKLTPGQITGSRPLQTTESQLAQLPFSAKPQQQIYDAQRLAFNRAVLEKAGINADNAAPEVIEKAYLTLGKQFDDLANKTELNVDRQFFDDINNVVQSAGRRLEANIKAPFKSYVEDIGRMSKAADIPLGSDTQLSVLTAPTQRVLIDGKTYAQIGTDLRAAMRGSRADPATSRAYKGLVEAFDGLMERSTSTRNWRAWKEARRKYRNLLIIDDAMKGNAKDIISGNIPFGTLKQSVAKMDPRGWSRGRGELNELARVGQFLAPRIPDSGTAGRTAMTKMLTGSMGPGSLAAGTGAYFADPMLALPAAAAPFAIPAFVQRAINSPMGRSYLTNQMFQQSPEQLRQMLGKVYIAQNGDRNR
jgi:hypothetical protein